MPAPKVAEGEAFAPDVEERHPQEIRGFDWLLLVRGAVAARPIRHVVTNSGRSGVKHGAAFNL
jgi:hypothetical protein